MTNSADKPRIRKMSSNYLVVVGSNSFLLNIDSVDSLGVEGALIAQRDHLITRYENGMNYSINCLNQMINDI